MKKYVVRNDGFADLKFDGEILGEASSHSHQGETQNRWVELALYRTEGGKYICSRIHRTIWDGERDTYEGAVCEGLHEGPEFKRQDEDGGTGRGVVGFFGYGWVSKKLYKDADLDVAEEIA